ncbi:alpha/beta fold hydrolase [Lichenicoccus sp.]|uniref:alpha/beta fold hydrolase n=1 Tax=Lichenicoccus sp. TaxID=2781899 RepID=UPI003D11AC86
MRIKPWLLGVPAVVGLAGAALAGVTGTVAARVERALPPLGRFVMIGGTRLHYVDEGPEQADANAPTIVLIHGLGAQLRNFTYGVVARLARTHRVVALDRPGSGYSLRAPGAPATLSAQADSVAALITALGLERPVVVGHSLGGAIALALALNHPDQVGALALIAPLTHPLDTPPAGLEGFAIASPWRRALTAWTLALPSAILNRNRVLAAVFGPEVPPADFPTRGGGLLSLRPSSFYGGSTDMVHSGADLPGMVARYRSLRLPVGVLYGSGDRILDPIVHGNALQALIPDLDLELVEGAGHMLPVTAPERTADFIERVAARRGDSV